MLFNWIPSLVMMVTPMAIAEMAIFAIMSTIVMANVNFTMAMSGFQLKSIEKLTQWR